MKTVLVFLIFSITPDTTLLLSAAQWIAAGQPAMVVPEVALSQGNQRKPLLFDTEPECQREVERQQRDEWLRPLPNQFRIPVCVAVPHPTN